MTTDTRSQDPGPVPVVVLLGAPAAGKSTVAHELIRRFPGWDYFGVRQQFVEERANDTDLWRRAAESQRNGSWIPDPVVIEAFRRRLVTASRVLLVDGMPANRNQARLLRNCLDETGRHLATTCYVGAPDAVCLARAAARRVCQACDGGIGQAQVDLTARDRCGRCGAVLTTRPDDAAARFTDRLRLHRRHIPDVVRELSDTRFTVVDGTANRDKVFEDVLAALDSVRFEAFAERGGQGR